MNPDTLEQKVGQLFFIGISGPAIDDSTRRLLIEIKPGGICLFSRNIKTADQTRYLLDALRENLPFEPFFSVDQEGGLVDRLRRIVTPMPSANKIRNARDASEFGEVVGELLSMLGFNMNFAPVVDVISIGRENPTNGLFSRGLGRDENEVTQFAGTFLDSLQAHGIIGCIKHFPGIGASAVDSHEELPQVNIDETEFDAVDLAPYRTLIRSNTVEMVMVGHAAYPHLKLQERDQNGRLLPSSLSHNFVTKVLRNDLGFGGIAITDDLEMGAVVNAYGIGEACKMAINAGNDMLAICAKESAVREGFNAVLEAVRSGAITESQIAKSLSRIERLRSKLSKPIDLDHGRLLELSEKIKVLNSRLS